MTINLRRLIETRDGTFGTLMVPVNHGGGVATYFTVERQSEGEHPRIPAGVYRMNLDRYHQLDIPAYEIVVPGRDRILLHPANLASELLGCVAPGFRLGFLNDKLAVLDSRKAFDDFMKMMGGEQTDWIVVTDPAK